MHGCLAVNFSWSKQSIWGARDVLGVSVTLSLVDDDGCGGGCGCGGGGGGGDYDADGGDIDY